MRVVIFLSYSMPFILLYRGLKSSTVTFVKPSQFLKEHQLLYTLFSPPEMVLNGKFIYHLQKYLHKQLLY